MVLRVHEGFEKYRGESTEGIDVHSSLRVFKTADGKCPLNTVRGVQLLYNEHHPAVKAKTDDLTRILQRFGQDPELEQQLIGAQEDDSPAGVRLQMVRDLIIKRQGMACLLYQSDAADDLTRAICGCSRRCMKNTSR